MRLPLPIRNVTVLCLAPLALVACKGGKKPDEARTAQGEVLPGSASDAMLPLDTVRSQPPLAPPEDTSGKGGKSAPAKGAAAADEADADQTEAAGASHAAPAPAPSIAADPVQ
jgi:hypothetical protein